MKKVHFHYAIVLRPEPEGSFTTMVPALPGCVTHGRTLSEAKKMAKDAILGNIESLRKHGEPIPTDGETLVASLASIMPGLPAVTHATLLADGGGSLWHVNRFDSKLGLVHGDQ